MKAKILLTAAFVLFVGAASSAAANAFHFELEASQPPADSTVASPDRVWLLFSEAPEDNTVGIRLIDRAGQAVRTSEPAVDPENSVAFFVRPAAPLPAGPYTVSWRGIGDDGHPVTGQFGFTVAAQ